MRKKDALLKEKTDLKLKNSGFGKESKSWVEPLKGWVQALEFAGKLQNETSDLIKFKEFAERVGSNRVLQDKKIGFAWSPAFRFLALDKEFQPNIKKSSDKAELKKGGQKKELLYWR